MGAEAQALPGVEAHLLACSKTSSPCPCFP